MEEEPGEKEAEELRGAGNLFLGTNSGSRESAAGTDHTISRGEGLGCTERDCSSFQSTIGRAYFAFSRTKGQLGAIEWPSTAGSEVRTEVRKTS